MSKEVIDKNKKEFSEAVMNNDRLKIAELTKGDKEIEVSSMFDDDEEIEISGDLGVTNPDEYREMAAELTKGTTHKKVNDSDLMKDQRVINLLTEKIPEVGGLYKEYPEDFSMKDVISETMKLIFLTAGMAKESGISLGAIENDPESLSRFVGTISDEIQERLNIYRPAGKDAARIRMGEWLVSNSDNQVMFVNALSGFPDGSLAYIIAGANEEFVTLEIDPDVVGLYSFYGENGFSKNIKPDQKQLKPAIFIKRWDEILEYGFCLTKRVDLVDGMHPEASTPEENKRGAVSYPEVAPGAEAGSIVYPESLLPTEPILKKKMESDFNDLSSEDKNKIATLSLTDGNSAIEICVRNNVDPSSFVRAMSQNGYSIDKEHGVFVTTPAEAPVVDETPEDNTGNALSSMMNFMG